MANHSANTVDVTRPQQNSPLYKLPPEIRVIIYKMVIQNIVEDVVAREMSTSSTFGRFPAIPKVGTFATLHTSSTLRGESLDLWLSSLQAEAAKLSASSERLSARLRAVTASYLSSYDYPAGERHWRAKGRATRLANATYQLKYLACLMIAWKSEPSSQSDTSAKRSKLLAMRVRNYGLA